MKEEYIVYILQSLKDGRFYTGYTNNLERRIREHENGKCKSTKNRRPFKVMFTKCFTSRSEALQFERFLKSPDGGPMKKTLVAQYNSSFKNE